MEKQTEQVQRKIGQRLPLFEIRERQQKKGQSPYITQQIGKPQSFEYEKNEKSQCIIGYILSQKEIEDQYVDQRTYKDKKMVIRDDCLKKRRIKLITGLPSYMLLYIICNPLEKTGNLIKHIVIRVPIRSDKSA